MITLEMRAALREYLCKAFGIPKNIDEITKDLLLKRALYSYERKVISSFRRKYADDIRASVDCLRNITDK